MSAIRFALLPVLLGASAVSVTPARGAAQEGSKGQAVQVAVQNRENGNVRVYAFQHGHMVPLGLVAGDANQTFTLPPGFEESGDAIQLLADPLDSTDWYKSDPVTIHPGSQVDFTIAGDLEGSSVSVKN